MAGMYSNLAGTCSKLAGTKFTIGKNEIPMKNPGVKRPGIRIIAKFCNIPTGFPNQDTEYGQILGYGPINRQVKNNLLCY